MAAFKSLFLILAITLVAEMAMAADYTVGAPSGSWDLRTKLATWASNKKFTVNDNLIFKYPSQQHNVLEVTKSNYDSCGLNSPIKTYATGNDKIPLSSAGTRYFICGIPSHCTLGMKVQINTLAVSTSAPPPNVPSTPPPKPSTPGMMSPPPMSPPPMPSTPGTMSPSQMPSTPSSGSKLQVIGGLGLLVLLAF